STRGPCAHRREQETWPIMPRVYRRAAARRDLIEHYVYLAEHADEPTADRFLERVKETFELLSTQREIGAPLTLRHPQLAGLRKWRVEDFEKFRPEERRVGKEWSTRSR